MYLTRDDILSQCKFPTDTVDVPEWGGAVIVRGMSAWERDRFEQLSQQYSNMEDVGSLTALVASWCIVDEDGKAIFKTSDLEALSKQNSHPLQRIFRAVIRLSTMGEGEVAKAKENFTSAQIENSSSD